MKKGKNYKDRKTINVEDIQDIIEQELNQEKYLNVYNHFKSYRQKRSALRKVFDEKQDHKFARTVEKLSNLVKSDEQNFSNDMINKFEKEQKKAMQNYLNQNFADLGTSDMWLNNYWNSNSDDELVNNFITNNYDNALTQLDRALKRGTLSQSGYDNALENLNTQKSGAFSTIGNIGQGIMDNYRTALSERAIGYNQNMDDYSLAKYGNVSADAFKSDFDKLYSDQQGNFEGEFNLATQDLQPFDISGIIGNARVAQGVNNTQTDELLGAIEDSEQKKDKKVGLGNKGMF